MPSLVEIVHVVLGEVKHVKNLRRRRQTKRKAYLNFNVQVEITSITLPNTYREFPKAIIG